MKQENLYLKEEDLIQVMMKIVMKTKDIDRRNVMKKRKKRVLFMEKTSHLHRRLKKMGDKKHLTKTSNLRAL